MLKYRAFLSYSHRDEAFARWLHNALERFVVPVHLRQSHNAGGRALGVVFRDRDELASSSSLSQSIHEALDQSSNLIVICSPSSAQSAWVDEEIRFFQSLGRAERIYCAIAQGEPPAVFAPSLLADSLYSEHLAADFRTVADGRQDALLKLIAGLLGVGFNELRQRELQRKQRRLIQITAASVAGMFITGGLAISAFLNQQEAQRQTLAANSVSQFLVELFEVSDPGVARGNEVTARELLDQGARKIRFGLQGQPRVRHRLTGTMAAVYSNLGLADQAQALFEENLTESKTLYGDDSLEFAQSLAALGNLFNQRGEFERAQRRLSQALDIESVTEPSLVYSEIASRLATAKQMLGAKEQAEQLMRAALASTMESAGLTSLETAQAQTLLGWLLREEQRFDEAELLLGQALETRRRLLGDDHFSIAETQDQLAELLSRKGDLDGASSLYEAAYRTKQKVLSPTHPEIVFSLFDIGDLHYYRSDLEQAELSLKEGIALGESIWSPDHVGLLRGIELLGLVYLDEGRYPEAATQMRRHLQISELAYDALNTQIARSLNNLGSVLAEQLGELDEGESYLRRAIAIFEANDERDYWHALTQWTLANTLRDKQMLGEAQQLYQSALQTMSALNTADQSNPQLPALQADYQLLLDARQQGKL